MANLARNGLRNRHLFALDLALVPVATLLAFALRFEGIAWPGDYPRVAATYLLFAIPIKISLLLAFGLYRRLWRFASVSELEGILFATGLSGSALPRAGGWVLPVAGITAVRVPLGVLANDALLTAFLVALPRLILRSIAMAPRRSGPRRSPGSHRRGRRRRRSAGQADQGESPSSA